MKRTEIILWLLFFANINKPFPREDNFLHSIKNFFELASLLSQIHRQYYSHIILKSKKNLTGVGYNKSPPLVRRTFEYGFSRPYASSNLASAKIALVLSS